MDANKKLWTDKIAYNANDGGIKLKIGKAAELCSFPDEMFGFGEAKLFGNIADIHSDRELKNAKSENDANRVLFSAASLLLSSCFYFEKWGTAMAGT